MSFYERLSRFVEKNHLNQSAIARDMGIDVQKLNATINGKRKMDVEEFENFCNTVNIDPSTLLGVYDEESA